MQVRLINFVSISRFFGSLQFPWPAGAASAAPRTGVVLRFDQWVGFKDLRYAIRLEEGRHILEQI